MSAIAYAQRKKLREGTPLTAKDLRMLRIEPAIMYQKIAAAPKA